MLQPSVACKGTTTNFFAFCFLLTAICSTTEQEINLYQLISPRASSFVVENSLGSFHQYAVIFTQILYYFSLFTIL